MSPAHWTEIQKSPFIGVQWIAAIEFPRANDTLKQRWVRDSGDTPDKPEELYKKWKTIDTAVCSGPRRRVELGYYGSQVSTALR